MSTICFRYNFDEKEDSGNDEASVKTVTSEDDNDMTWILYCTVLYCTVLYCTDLEPMEASTPCLLTVSMLSSGWMSVTLRLLVPATWTNQSECLGHVTRLHQSQLTSSLLLLLPATAAPLCCPSSWHGAIVSNTRHMRIFANQIACRLQSLQTSKVS